MKKFAVLAAALALMAVGTMANKCDYSPTFNEPKKTDEQKAPDAPAPAPAEQPKQ